MGRIFGLRAKMGAAPNDEQVCESVTASPHSQSSAHTMKILRLSLADAALAAIAIERIKPTRTNKELVGRFLERPEHYFIAAIEDNQPIGFVLAYEL